MIYFFITIKEMFVLLMKINFSMGKSVEGKKLGDIVTKIEIV